MIETNVAFIYWGRRGFSRFTLEAAHAARRAGLNAFFSISTSNELFAEFRQLGDIIFPVDTFRTTPGALLNLPHVPEIRRSFLDWLVERQIETVVTLMPHVWTPLISTALRRQGMRYAVVIHDAKPHLGDPTGMIFNWLLTDARTADCVVTLSEFVRKELVRQGTAPAERIKTVRMPPLEFPGAPPHSVKKARRHETSPPLRILYFGRLMTYKGLRLFADAMESLAANGPPIEITVCGEGQLGDISSRLANLGAAVTNRWLTDDEVGQMLGCHDLVVLTHIEASQSGVVSASLGAGVPVVTTPVGGLAEQVRISGAELIAERVDGQAIADCVRSLALDCSRYNRIVDHISSPATFSMTQFLRELIAAISATRCATLPLPQVGSAINVR